jgi:hypothetical protein
MSIFRRGPHPILAPGAVSVAPRPKPSGPTPDEELPDWVMSSVLVFLEPFFASGGPLAYSGTGFGYGEEQQRNFLREIERTCQITVPWQNGPVGAANGVWQQMYRDRTLAVRVIEYALGEMMLGYDAQGIEPAVKELHRALKQAGANYVVVQPDPEWGRYRLERRTVPAAAAAARAQTSLPGNASDHLGKAWSAAFGREPNPSAAYSESVKAVEAAAIPLVLPNDRLATLGKVVSELRTNRQKYSVVFSRDASPAKGTTLSPLEVVIALADSLWSNQTDRHAPILPITQAQAELAVNLAVTLVHTFRSAVISPAK